MGLCFSTASPPKPVPFSVPSSHDNHHVLEKPNLKEFSFEDLKCATQKFRCDQVDSGDYSLPRVYKGWLDEHTLTPVKPTCGIPVTVKVLKSESLEEWQSEVNILGSLAHPNVVKLLGYSKADSELLLVHEFMPKGSLENHLFTGNMEPLPWNTRLKIATDAARGLAFLHTYETPVIFRDFKPSCILLDGNFNAKISDFGLAKLGLSEEQSHVSTRVMGTYGYAAPEYIATGHLYVKSDVYGFGVVLLEILTGMGAIDRERPTGQQNLVDWAKPLLSSKRKLNTIMDRRIEGHYSLMQAFQTAQLTLKCLKYDPKQRPTMKEVLEALETIAAYP